MRRAALLIAIAIAACRSATDADYEFRGARELVSAIVAENPDVVRLTIHAVPAGEKESRIIACNVPEKLGQPSDPEDLEAMRTGKIVVLREGDHLDVTAPIVDPAGVPVAATGITLVTGYATESALVEKAKAIARRLSLAVASADHPLW